jgi:hypothetical protein
MSDAVKTIEAWFSTSAVKIACILIAVFILSQMSRWTVRWNDLHFEMEC